VRFEWNPEKAAENLRKHKISFAEASEVFDDPNEIDGFDSEHSEDEERFWIIGFSSRRLLFVVFCERGAEAIRLISARRANQREKEIYDNRK
jgi:uncharacterized protein